MNRFLIAAIALSLGATAAQAAHRHRTAAIHETTRRTMGISGTRGESHRILHPGTNAAHLRHRARSAMRRRAPKRASRPPS